MHTLNFAHRGFSGKYPENTMLAFQAAVEVHGCDGIELDVQLTKDGQVVICHDEQIDRTCTSGHRGLVKDYTWDQLCKMDYSYGHPELSGQCPMPSLREYFSYVQDKEIQTNIELKTGVFEYTGIEEKVYDLICEYDLQEKVIISSFNHYSIMRMKKLCSNLRCGFLSGTWILNPGKYVQDAGCEFYHPEYHMVTPEIAEEAAAYGIGINAWTVNTEEDMQRMIDLHAAAIIGNYPDLAAQILKQKR